MLRPGASMPHGVQHTNPMLRKDSGQALTGHLAGQQRPNKARPTSGRAKYCIAAVIVGIVVLGVVVGVVLALTAQESRSGDSGGRAGARSTTMSISAASVLVGMSKATFDASPAIQRAFSRGVALAADTGDEDSVS
jgi:hypothetical protein